MTLSRFIWHSAAVTNQGNVRDHNEDACLDAAEQGLWAVADGMGGHDSGDYASQLIVERLRGVSAGARPSELVNRVEDELLDVNRHLYDKSMEGERPTVIGSTVVVLMAFDGFCVSAWAGDSRIYRLRGNRLTRISRDHSEVQALVDQGVISEDEAESHPQANVITRAVGGADKLYLDYELQALEPGDRYLLCSDGLYKDVSEPEIARFLGQGDCRTVSDGLLALALSRTCNDNVTVLAVDFERAAAAAAPGGEPSAEGEAGAPAT